MLVQEVITDLPPADVIGRAKDFFLSRFDAYPAFVIESDDQHARFHIDTGEVMIGALPRDGRTLVRGSSSRIHHEIGQFLMTLAPAEEVHDDPLSQSVSGAG